MEQNDGQWGIYGQKHTKDSAFPRRYMRCKVLGCPAKKIEQRVEAEPLKVCVTYIHEHTHQLAELPPSPPHRKRPTHAPAADATAATSREDHPTATGLGTGRVGGGKPGTNAPCARCLEHLPKFNNMGTALRGPSVQTSAPGVLGPGSLSQQVDLQQHQQQQKHTGIVPSEAAAVAGAVAAAGSAFTTRHRAELLLLHASSLASGVNNGACRGSQPLIGEACSPRTCNAPLSGQGGSGSGIQDAWSERVKGKEKSSKRRRGGEEEEEQQPATPSGSPHPMPHLIDVCDKEGAACTSPSEGDAGFSCRVSPTWQQQSQVMTKERTDQRGVAPCHQPLHSTHPSCSKSNLGLLEQYLSTRHTSATANTSNRVCAESNLHTSPKGDRPVVRSTTLHGHSALDGQQIGISKLQRGYDCGESDKMVAHSQGDRFAWAHLVEHDVGDKAKRLRPMLGRVEGGLSIQPVLEKPGGGKGREGTGESHGPCALSSSCRNKPSLVLFGKRLTPGGV